MAKELTHECGSTTRQEILATSEKPYHFADSGLPNIYLVGVRHFRCDCGEKLVEIPALKQLMSLIARHVVMKHEALTGAEIRFLRKRLGQKATDFAARMKMQPETLSRIENGKQSIGDKADSHIRLYYALASKDPILLDAMKEALDSVLVERRKTPSKKQPRTVARVAHNEWALATTA